jgi:hypothetical protein
MTEASMASRDPDAMPKMAARGLAVRCARFVPLVAVLALGSALSACDKCTDFPWQTRPGACKSGPAPN